MIKTIIAEGILHEAPHVMRKASIADTAIMNIGIILHRFNATNGFVGLQLLKIGNMS